MKHNIPDDQELLRRHLAGDDRAFSSLVERYRQLVWNMARALSDENAADDCCQAVFLLLDRKAKRLRSGSRPLADWLLACVRRITANHRRAERRRHKREATATQTIELDPPTEELPTDLLLEAIDALPVSLRNAVVLHHLEGLERPLAAQRLGCSVEAMNKRLQRAMTALRDALSRQGYSAALSATLCSLGFLRQADAAPPTTTICQAVSAPSNTITALVKGVTAMPSIIAAGLSLASILTMFAVAAIPTPPSETATQVRTQTVPTNDAATHVLRALLLYKNDANKANIVELTAGTNPAEKTASQTTIADWFSREERWSSQILHELELAATRSDCYWDRDLSLGDSMLMPELDSIRQVVSLVLMRARWRQSQGNFEGAANDCMVAQALGRHLQRDRIITMGMMGLSIEAQALVTIVELARSWPPALRDKTAHRIAILNALGKGLPQPGRWLAGERTIFETVVEPFLAENVSTETCVKLGLDDLTASLPLDRRQAMVQEAMDFYTQLIHQINLPPDQANQPMQQLMKRLLSEKENRLLRLIPSVSGVKKSHTVVACLNSNMNLLMGPLQDSVSKRKISMSVIFLQAIHDPYTIEQSPQSLILRWPAIGLEQSWDMPKETATIPAQNQRRIEF